MKDVKTLKAVQGGIGLFCMGYWSYDSETCSTIISNFYTSYMAHAFTVVLKPSFLCGIALSTCTTPVKQTVASYALAKLADKPASITSNTYLTDIYTTIRPQNGRGTY